MGKVTVAGFRPGDRVLGWTVVRNEPLVGSDGEVIRHDVVLKRDGAERTARLPRGRKYEVER